MVVTLGTTGVATLSEVGKWAYYSEKRVELGHLRSKDWQGALLRS